MCRRQRTLEHETAAAVDFVPRPANRSGGHDPFRPIDQIIVEHPRQPLPEPMQAHCTIRDTGGSIGSDDPHRGFSKFHILLRLNVHASAYKFETERRPFS
jgi:hypothetical protein